MFVRRPPEGRPPTQRRTRLALEAVLVIGVSALVLEAAVQKAGGLLAAIVTLVLAGSVGGYLRVVERSQRRDPELGIANRAGVHAAVDRLLRQGPTTVLVLLPARFHELLAAVGRARSDALLSALAQRLSHAAGADATVGRIAPACFAVAFPVSPDDDARMVRLTDALDEPLVVDGVPYPVHAALGSATGPHDADDAADLLDRAEIALHSVTGPVRRYHRGIEQTARHRLAVLSDLERALADGQLRLHFQPIIDLATGAVDCVEALVRWDHPVHGAMPPATFIPLAEQTDLIGPLTEHVLRLALDQCAGWRAQGTVLTVAVNLSARNVSDPTLPDDRREDAGGARARRQRAEARDHRERADGAAAGGVRDPGRATPPGRDRRAGRLRHRLLVPRLPAGPADRRGEDRP